MNWTHADQEEFRRLFALKRRRQMFLSVPFIAVVIGVLVIRERGDQALLGIPVSLWGPGFFLFAVGAVLFSLWNWRCPACDKYLGKGISPRFCPRCGVALQSDT